MTLYVAERYCLETGTILINCSRHTSSESALRSWAQANSVCSLRRSIIGWPLLHSNVTFCFYRAINLESIVQDVSSAIEKKFSDAINGVERLEESLTGSTLFQLLQHLQMHGLPKIPKIFTAHNYVGPDLLTDWKHRN